MSLLNVLTNSIDSAPLLKMLVVDDDQCLLKLYEFVVGRWELNVDLVLVDSGVDAILYLEKNSPDLLILDLNLFDMDGRDVIQFVKEKKQHQSMKIVVISGTAGINIDSASGFPENVVFMRKPIDFVSLLSLAADVRTKPRQVI